MKTSLFAAMVGLLIAGSVIAANASIIYQDDFQVNDYDLRYNTDRTAVWEQPAWQYFDLGSGNVGFAPGMGVGYIGFSTKDYLNGHFTSTSYTVKASFVCPNNVAPALSIDLLNNGWGTGNGNGVRHFGYEAEFSNGGCVAMGLHRHNLDGTTTELVPTNYAWVGPVIWNANLSVMSTLTASVNVMPTETDLTFTWEGLTLDLSAPANYSISYQDTSEGRFASGTGIGIVGYAGEGSSNGMILDSLTISEVTYPVSGHVVLSDYSGTSADALAIVLFSQGGAVVRTARVPLDESGNFTIPDVLAGTYDVTVKTYANLSQSVAGVDVSGDTNLGTFSLAGGDIDGDNEVTSTDLSILGLNLGLMGS